MYSAKCFLEVNNGVSGNNRIRQGVPVAYDSIAELILCNVRFKLRRLKFKTVTMSYLRSLKYPGQKNIYGKAAF